VTVNIQQLPQHSHFVQAAAVDGNTTDGAGNTFAQVPGRIYTDPAALTTLLPTTVSSVGGSQPHENRQPYTVLNFIIALQGIFPSQN
jgi:microcystin-dependent protein